MNNLEKIASLNEIWYDFIGHCHHKDRDCHFYITQTFSYGGKGKWTVAHHGYINHRYEEQEFDSYEECQVELIKLLCDSILEEVEWYLNLPKPETMGDYDDHPRYNKKDLEEIINKVKGLT